MDGEGESKAQIVGGRKGRLCIDGWADVRVERCTPDQLAAIGAWPIMVPDQPRTSRCGDPASQGCNAATDPTYFDQSPIIFLQFYTAKRNLTCDRR